ALEDWVVGLLRGDAYGPLLQLAGSAASAKVAGDDLDQILRWLKAVAADNRGQALELMEAVDELLSRDHEGSMMQVMRNLIGPGTIASGASRAEVFADAFADVSSVDSGDACKPEGGMDLPRLEDAVAGARDFLLDDKGGITTIWKLIGTAAP